MFAQVRKPLVYVFKAVHNKVKWKRAEVAPQPTCGHGKHSDKTRRGRHCGAETPKVGKKWGVWGC